MLKKVLLILILACQFPLPHHGYAQHNHDEFAPGHCPWCKHDGSILDPQRIKEVLSWHPPGMPEEANGFSILFLMIGVTLGVISYLYYRSSSEK
jgi:hypothetical protein